MLTPTPSRDGRYRASVRTDHRLTGRQVAMLLCHHAEQAPRWYDLDNYPGVDMTRAQAEQEIRTWVRVYGADAYDGEGFTEDDNDAEVIGAVRWAYRQVQRLFPQLADADLDAWAAKWEQAADASRVERAAQRQLMEEENDRALRAG